MPERNLVKHAHVLTVSTRAAAGVYPDTTGPQIANWLAGHGFAVQTTIVPDRNVTIGIQTALATGPRILITTGGTGLSADDQTPQATAPYLSVQVPGVIEEIRRRGFAHTPNALLTRGLCGLSGQTLVLNLPGTPGGVRDGLAVLDEILDHLLHQISGGGHE